MGNFTSIYRRLLSRKEDVRILMAGLDAAGKTSIVYKLKIGKFVTTIPTIGLNVETVEYKNIRFTVLDVGGQEKVRPLWRHYYKGTRALIFVVDSNDKERLSEAQYELQLMLNAEELKDAAVLVFANKQDLPKAMHPDAIAKRLGLSSPNIQRPWHIQESSATTGEGLFEGLDWLSSNLAGSKPKK